MVDDLISSAISASYNNTCSVLSHNPIAADFNTSFIAYSPCFEFSQPYIPVHRKAQDTRTRHYNKSGTFCNSVLKYINRVLMGDDDFEDKPAIVKDPKLDATKRSFNEIIVGDTHRDVDDNKSEDPTESDTEATNNKCQAIDEPLIYDTLGKIVLHYGKKDELLSNTHYSVLSRKGANKREAAYMRNLLLQCMEYVASSEHEAANKLLKDIRSRSSPHGDWTQRLAHCFANGLKARLDGGRIQEHTSVAIRVSSDADCLKAFKIYFTDFPFQETAFFFANQMIMDLVEKTNTTSASTLHIIHFGLMHGFQWPPLIQLLSERTGGPPKLRITGIDFPQPGFRPDARIKETGRRLANYCKEFNVPFEFNSFSKNWDNVKLEDLKIKKDELVVVNCMYHFMYLLDDSMMESSPRDTTLNLIKGMNPDIFIHVVVNAGYNSPFFVSRFKEALFHFSSWFEMFDAVLPLESPGRLVFERDVWGKEVMNIVASEGLKRTERPETYKQWHKRSTRAGFKMLPLNKRIVSDIQDRVKSSYAKNFFVDEVGNWLLDGWKGKAFFALSCWKPA